MHFIQWEVLLSRRVLSLLALGVLVVRPPSVVAGTDCHYAGRAGEGSAWVLPLCSPATFRLVVQHTFYIQPPTVRNAYSRLCTAKLEVNSSFTFCHLRAGLPHLVPSLTVLSGLLVVGFLV